MKRSRKRPPKVSLVVACSQRKRITPPAELRLASVGLNPDLRVQEWTKRLSRVEAPRLRAEDLYSGDHWHAARTAYRLTLRYTSRAELWVVSAGYGLVGRTKLLKSYSATFASGSPDSVWRGPSDGDRQARLHDWWQALPHDVSLADLLDRRDGVVVIAAGAAYVAVLADDLAALLEQDDTGDRVSVISAGSRGNGYLLPASGQLRAMVGGTDGALNARLLALLTEGAEVHRFRRSGMSAVLARAAAQVPTANRPAGRPVSDDQVARRIAAIRRRRPMISRTQALREFRQGGIACEQSRFASVWKGVVGEPVQWPPKTQ